MSADTYRTVETKVGDVVYDSDMPISALKSIMGASSNGDLGAIITGLASFVTEWEFEGDPSDTESWDSLKRSQFNAVVTAVMEDLGSLGNE